MSLNRLIAEASALAGGKHQCAELGHDWQSEGGRRCPRAAADSAAASSARALAKSGPAPPSQLIV